MKIMFVVNSMNKGGAERVIANLSSYFSKENDVNIVTIYNSVISYELAPNVNVLPLDDFKTDLYSELKPKENKIKKIWKYIKRIRKLNYYKTKKKPDIIISFSPVPSFLTLFSNFSKKIKTIVSVRNDPQKEFKSKFFQILMNYLYPKADGIVFQTEDARSYFKESIIKKSIIIPNPINLDFVVQPFQGKRKKEIVNVARLEEQKNQKLLISAFNSVLKKHPAYKLTIYGEGKLRKELENLIKKLDLNQNVFLAGVSNQIKEDIYKARMFVLSSNYEGMPNALMEAMALGLPVISTDCPCGGPKFLIQNNENGILVPTGNVDALTNAMLKIIENEEFSSEIGMQANKLCEQLHPDKINKIWETYIFAVRDEGVKNE